jgi:signal transduction histidine kinase
VKSASQVESEAEATQLRGLQVASEVAHAFLTSKHPLEVYRLALERVAPLVRAEFGCIFLREEESGLLRLAAACNWPQAYASYLSTLRIRPGSGPTGTAYAEGREVEVDDVFADPALSDWWESARELGWRSTISLPLVSGGEPVGVLTLYFSAGSPLDERERRLLRLLADQLSAAAEKAQLIDDLRAANDQLRRQNAELEIRYREAEQARRLKSEFLANVSHELRTPLTAILGFTQLLGESADGPVQMDREAALGRIEGAANTLLRLINDLLDLARLRDGSVPLERESCDATLLARAALLAARDAPSGVELRSELPEGELVVHTDPVQVVKILEALLANALKFTERGSVTLRLREEGGGERVCFEVEDTGIGIPEEHLESIFEEFRQIDGSPTRRHGGAGIGLSLARGLARHLGGELSARSASACGSTFTLQLPAHPPEERP